MGLGINTIIFFTFFYGLLLLFNTMCNTSIWIYAACFIYFYHRMVKTCTTVCITIYLFNLLLIYNQVISSFCFACFCFYLLKTMLLEILINMSTGTQVQEISHHLNLKMEVLDCKVCECSAIPHQAKLFSK